MWKVEESSNSGVRRELQFEASDGRPLDSRWVADAGRSIANEEGSAIPWHLVDFYSERTDVPFANAIDAWAGAAVEEAAAGLEHEFGSELELFEAEPGLVVTAEGTSDAEGGRGRRVEACHDATAIVVPIPGRATEDETYRVTLSYDDEYRRWPSQLHGRYETFLEYRLYQGSESAVIDGVMSFPKRGGRRVASVIAHGGGLLVGTVVRVASRGTRTIEEDPLWRERLKRLESTHKTACSMFPRATRGTRTQAPECVVLVHGTFSCGMKVARELTSLKPCVPIYRFEHDTFRPIAENARNLADIVGGIGATRVLLVAHSRGGLVATAAAIHLQLQHRPIEVELWTYGTPHAGTPLVKAGNNVLGWLYRLGADLESGVAVPTPLHGAATYFLATGALPPGISAMDPDGDAVRSHQSFLEYVQLKKYGGEIDPHMTQQTVPGRGFAKGLARTVFGGRSNDLVVPLDSACWNGGEAPLQDCGHTNFFQQPSVRKAIAAYGCPPGDGDIDIRYEEDVVGIGIWDLDIQE